MRRRVQQRRGSHCEPEPKGLALVRTLHEGSGPAEASEYSQADAMTTRGSRGAGAATRTAIALATAATAIIVAAG
jgi:hypothetical protein